MRDVGSQSGGATYTFKTTPRYSASEDTSRSAPRSSSAAEEWRGREAGVARTDMPRSMTADVSSSMASSSRAPQPVGEYMWPYATPRGKDSSPAPPSPPLSDQQSSQVMGHANNGPSPKHHMPPPPPEPQTTIAAASIPSPMPSQVSSSRGGRREDAHSLQLLLDFLQSSEPLPSDEALSLAGRGASNPKVILELFEGVTSLKAAVVKLSVGNRGGDEGGAMDFERSRQLQQQLKACQQEVEQGRGRERQAVTRLQQALLEIERLGRGEGGGREERVRREEGAEWERKDQVDKEERLRREMKEMVAKKDEEMLMRERELREEIEARERELRNEWEVERGLEREREKEKDRERERERDREREEEWEREKGLRERLLKREEEIQGEMVRRERGLKEAHAAELEKR